MEGGGGGRPSTSSPRGKQPCASDVGEAGRRQIDDIGLSSGGGAGRGEEEKTPPSPAAGLDTAHGGVVRAGAPGREKSASWVKFTRSSGSTISAMRIDWRPCAEMEGGRGPGRFHQRRDGGGKLAPASSGSTPLRRNIIEDRACGRGCWPTPSCFEHRHPRPAGLDHHHARQAGCLVSRRLRAVSSHRSRPYPLRGSSGESAGAFSPPTADRSAVRRDFRTTRWSGHAHWHAARRNQRRRRLRRRESCNSSGGVAAASNAAGPPPSTATSYSPRAICRQLRHDT